MTPQMEEMVRRVASAMFDGTSMQTGLKPPRNYEELKKFFVEGATWGFKSSEMLRSMIEQFRAEQERGLTRVNPFDESLHGSDE